MSTSNLEISSDDRLQAFTKQDVMRRLSISSTTFYRLIRPDPRTGQPLLESYRLKPGGPRRVSREQLQRFLDSRVAASAAPFSRFAARARTHRAMGGRRF
jgi:hypothetical protein